MRMESAPGLIRHLASGLRRHVPVPVQGASTKTRSQRPSRSAKPAPPKRGGCTCTLRTPARFSLGAAHKPCAVAVGCVNLPLILHQRRKREALTASARAKIEHLLACLRKREKRGKLRGFLLDFDKAFDVSGLGRKLRRAAVQREREPQANGRKRRWAWAKMGKAGACLVARSLERIDPQIDGCAERKRLHLGDEALAEDCGE